MKIMRQIFGILGLLVSNAAFADYWCPPGPEEEARARGECVDASPRDVKNHREKWYAASRKEAQQLPVDYQDLIFRFLTHRAPTRKDAFCLVVFDDQPPAPLIRRLRAAGRNVRQCNASKPDFRYVQRIRQIGPDKFLMNYQSFCGSLCAGEWEITITRNADDSFSIDEKLLWIS